MSTLSTTSNNGIKSKLLWASIAALGAVSFGIIALSRGETISAAWLVIAALCTYFIAYRFYSLFIAEKVLGVDPTRQTPAYCHNDGLDYVPTNRYVLFGHHFAAIAGAGPLVGPVLAAQMGYLPGTIWILAGVVFAGAVQDMTVLFLSTRRDGRSLGDMVRSEMGPVAGGIALIGVLLIMIILLAVLALVVVKALMGSPWGTFTVFCTIPIALLMGIYARFIRVGRIAEMSAIGIVLLLAALIYGRTVSENPALAAWFDLKGETMALAIIAYGFVASVLPVWLLLAPRDYLGAARGRYHPGPTRVEDAGAHQVHRRHRPSVVGQHVPVPLHHHRLRRGVRLPFADRVGNDSEDAGEREPGPHCRIWRDVDGILRRHHGDDRGDRT
jgi:carbon starvation protein